MTLDRLARPGRAFALVSSLLALASVARGQTALATVLVAGGLDRPTFATTPPDAPSHLFVVESAGRIRIIGGGILQAEPFLDVAAATGQQDLQLVSMAFDPSYAESGQFYVYYKGLLPDGRDGLLLERYTVSSTDLATANPASRALVLGVPTAPSQHVGAGPLFGPGGLLYVVIGEGEQGSCASQDPSNLLGSVLRIDVRDGLPYSIPASNPFVGVPGYASEVWSIGWRNPWRASFDRATGEFYIADVGGAIREEIDYEPALFGGGANYGWPREEGSQEPAHAHPCPPGTPLHGDPRFTRPIHEFDHSQGDCSVVGGYVYRGTAVPDLRGTYFFADYCTGRISSFRHSVTGISELRDRTSQLQPVLADPIGSIVSFAEDAAGEMYIISYGAGNGTQPGSIHKIVAAGSTYCSPASPNSTGAAAFIAAHGSARPAHNDLSLLAYGLPPSQSGYFLTSRTAALFIPPGSQGFVCLGGQVGRFSGQVIQGPIGSIRLDLSSIPVNPPAAVVSGETWNFQCWYRDVGATSNFTDAVSLTFL